MSNPRVRDSYTTVHTTAGKWEVWRKQMGHGGHRSFVGSAPTEKEAREIVRRDKLARSRKIQP
jgi:hypothetical protein